MHPSKSLHLLVSGWALLVAVTAFKLNAIGNSPCSSLTSMGNCECNNSTCNCCQNISLFGFTDLACVNVTSLSPQNEVKFTLTLGGALYINDTYRDAERWPSCVEFDDQGIAYVCVIFYNMTFSETHVSGCLKLGVLVEAEIIIPLKCFTLPRTNAVAMRREIHENIIAENSSPVEDDNLMF